MALVRNTTNDEATLFVGEVQVMFAPSEVREVELPEEFELPAGFAFGEGEGETEVEEAEQPESTEEVTE